MGSLTSTSTTSSTSADAPFSIIFFGIETGGLAFTSDVLQIAMKCNETEFNMYINPSRNISDQATKINGLTNNRGNLYHRGIKINSYSKKVVLNKLLEYLESTGTRCILVAYNCNAFHAPRLIKIIKEVSLLDKFRNVVAGFVDCLPMFRKKFPERISEGQFKLTALATEILQLPEKSVTSKVTKLQQLVLHCFERTELLEVENIQTFDFKLQLLNENKRTQVIKNTPLSINDVISDEMRTRLAKVGISYELLVDTYRRSKTDAKNLLTKSVNGEPPVIQTENGLNIILQHLKEITGKS